MPGAPSLLSCPRPLSVSLAGPRLASLLHNLEHAPPLLFGDGACLGDADEVAHAALVLLVVDLEAGALLHRLAIQTVRLRRGDLDDDGLVHLVGDDGAQADLAPAARRGRGCLSGGVAHSASSLLFATAMLGLGRLFLFDHLNNLIRGRQLCHGHGRRLLLSARGDPEVALPDDRHDPRDVVADFGDLARVLELADGVLEPELVQLAARRAQPHPELVCLEDAKLVDLHLELPLSAEETKRVLIGSFAAASFIASLATCGVTPPISNSTRPGLIAATQPSGFPLPDPIQVSPGFLLIDFSGETRIHIWSPRLTCLVIAPPGLPARRPRSARHAARRPPR